MVKELVEDVSRSKADKQENTRLVRVWDPKQSIWVASVWENVQVGDIVRVLRDDQVWMWV